MESNNIGSSAGGLFHSAQRLQGFIHGIAQLTTFLPVLPTFPFIHSSASRRCWVVFDFLAIMTQAAMLL